MSCSNIQAPSFTCHNIDLNETLKNNAGALLSKNARKGLRLLCQQYLILELHTPGPDVFEEKLINGDVVTTRLDYKPVKIKYTDGLHEFSWLIQPEDYIENYNNSLKFAFNG